MNTRQCLSCGGFCKKSGCERANSAIAQPASQNPKFTMDEWAAHALKHQWRFDEEPVTCVATVAQPAQPADLPTYSELDRIASDLQVLCDQQALRLGALDAQPDLTSLIKKAHKAKGRYHTQLAMCDLFDACGLPNFRPGSEPVQPATANSIEIDFKQATELLQMFGGEPTSITLMLGDGHSGKGLYAHYTEMPDEGAEYLGVADDEATLIAQPEQEPVGFLCHGNLYKWPSEDDFCGNPEDHIPLYTSPPQRKPLTTEVAMKLLAALLNILECDEDDRIPSDLAEEARAAIEAAHDIKEQNK